MVVYRYTDKEAEMSADKKTGGGFHGIYPMLFALFGRDGALDRQAMRRQIDAMVDVGAHGIAVLGLATESNKLSLDERQMLLDWVAEDLAGRLPLSVTVPGPNVAEQVALAQQAKACGAQWLVLQPPPVTGVPEAALAEYFSAVIGKVDLPTGLQIAPEYLGNAVSGDTALEIARRHSNLSLLKVEMSAYTVGRLIRETGGKFSVFNGMDGVDLPDSIRAGCAGCIPGAEFADVLVKVFNGLVSEKPADRQAADEAYVRLAPLLTFMMDSLDRFLVYGKRILCNRIGLPADNASVRSPAGSFDVEGDAIVTHWTRTVGKFAA